MEEIGFVRGHLERRKLGGERFWKKIGRREGFGLFHLLVVFVCRERVLGRLWELFLGLLGEKKGREDLEGIDVGVLKDVLEDDGVIFVKVGLLGFPSTRTKTIKKGLGVGHCRRRERTAILRVGQLGRGRRKSLCIVQTFAVWIKFGPLWIDHRHKMLSRRLILSWLLWSVENGPKNVLSAHTHGEG